MVSKGMWLRQTLYMTKQFRTIARGNALELFENSGLCKGGRLFVREGFAQVLDTLGETFCGHFVHRRCRYLVHVVIRRLVIHLYRHGRLVHHVQEHKAIGKPVFAVLRVDRGQGAAKPGEHKQCLNDAPGQVQMAQNRQILCGAGVGRYDRVSDLFRFLFFFFSIAR